MKQGKVRQSGSKIELDGILLAAIEIQIRLN
jgi:hypothetical protein